MVIDETEFRAKENTRNYNYDNGFLYQLIAIALCLI